MGTVDRRRPRQTETGRSETFDDAITAVPVRSLSATLDRDDLAPEPGTALPALWHWLYFLPHARQSEIGPDGHARSGYLTASDRQGARLQVEALRRWYAYRFFRARNPGERPDATAQSKPYGGG